MAEWDLYKSNSFRINDKRKIGKKQYFDIIYIFFIFVTYSLGNGQLTCLL